MPRRAPFSWILALAAIIALLSWGGSNAAAVSSVPDVKSSDGVASLTLTSALDSNGRPAFFYRGSGVPPTIRVRPGDTIRLRYVNKLPEYCGFGIVAHTNLHFHGLTTSPNQPGDEVIVTNAAPGSSVTYDVNDAAQPPAVPSLAGLRERVIVLRDVFDDPSAPLRRIDDGVDTKPCGPEIGKTPTIDGKRIAAIGIQPGERQLWRVLNASGGRHLDLHVPGARLQLVAQDGIPFADYAGGAASQIVDHIVIPPAGRAEFVVTGPSAPAPSISECYDAGPSGDPNPRVTLAELYNDYGATSTARVAADGAAHGGGISRASTTTGVTTRLVRLQETGDTYFIDGVSYRPSAAPMFTVKTGTTERWILKNDTAEGYSFHTHQAHFVVQANGGVP